MTDEDKAMKVAADALKIATQAQTTIDMHLKSCESLGEQAREARKEMFKQIASLRKEFGAAQRKLLWALLGVCLTVIASLVIEVVRGRL